MNREIDVRHVLPAIRVPTLVIHGVEDAHRSAGSGPLDDRADTRRAAAWRSRRRPPALRPRHRGGQSRRSERSSRTSGTPGAGTTVELRPRARDGALHRHRRLERAAGRAGRPRVARAARAAPRARARASCSAFAARRSTPRATASSRASTGPRAASGVRARSSTAVSELGIEVRAGLHTGECEVRRRQGGGYRRPHGSARGVAGRRRGGARVEHGQGSRRRLRHRLRRPRRCTS